LKWKKRKDLWLLAVLLWFASSFPVSLVHAAEDEFLAESAQVEAEEKSEPRLFLLSPTVKWYFPTEQKTRDAFGSVWFGVGVSLNTEALGWGSLGFGTGGVRFYPYFGYFSSSHGDNDAHLIPLGLEARWNLAERGVLRPYLSVGLAGYGVKFEDREVGIDTGWKAAFGGRLMFGTDITKWFNLQVAYNILSDVQDYNFNGFSIQGKLRIYF
jgi:hypothetical protein